MTKKDMSQTIGNIAMYGEKNEQECLEKSITELICTIAHDNIGRINVKMQNIIWHSVVKYQLVNEAIQTLCSDIICNLRQNIYMQLGAIFQMEEEKRELELRCLAASIAETDIENLVDSFPDISVEQVNGEEHKQILCLLMRCQIPNALRELEKRSPEGFVFVPAGTFVLGSQNNPDEICDNTVWLPSYYISKFPVTVHAFKKYAQEINLKHPLNNIPDSFIPAHGINWYEAYDYAYKKGSGFKLPTEAQWEKAARGTNGFLFPWGNEFNSNKANTFENNIDEFTPVDKYSPDGDSPFGVSDMVGNCWEWTASLYLPYQDFYGDFRGARDDGRDRVLRGGAYDFDQYGSNCTNRYRCNPGNGWDTHGFRVVFSL